MVFPEYQPVAQNKAQTAKVKWQAVGQPTAAAQ